MDQNIYVTTGVCLETAFQVASRAEAAPRSQYNMIRENFIAFGVHPEPDIVPFLPQTLRHHLSRIETQFGLVNAADCAVGLMEKINGATNLCMGEWVLNRVEEILPVSPRKAAGSALMVLLNVDSGSSTHLRAAEKVLDLLLDDRISQDTAVVETIFKNLEREVEPKSPFRNRMETVRQRILGYTQLRLGPDSRLDVVH